MEENVLKAEVIEQNESFLDVYSKQGVCYDHEKDMFILCGCFGGPDERVTTETNSLNSPQSEMYSYDRAKREWSKYHIELHEERFSYKGVFWFDNRTGEKNLFLYFGKISPSDSENPCWPCLREPISYNFRQQRWKEYPCGELLKNGAFLDSSLEHIVHDEKDYIVALGNTSRINVPNMPKPENGQLMHLINILDIETGKWNFHEIDFPVDLVSGLVYSHVVKGKYAYFRLGPPVNFRDLLRLSEKGKISILHYIAEGISFYRYDIFERKWEIIEKNLFKYTKRVIKAHSFSLGDRSIGFFSPFFRFPSFKRRKKKREYKATSLTVYDTITKKWDHFTVKIDDFLSTFVSNPVIAKDRLCMVGGYEKVDGKCIPSSSVIEIDLSRCFRGLRVQQAIDDEMERMEFMKKFVGCKNIVLKVNCGGYGAEKMGVCLSKILFL